MPAGRPLGSTILGHPKIADINHELINRSVRSVALEFGVSVPTLSRYKLCEWKTYFGQMKEDTREILRNDPVTKQVLIEANKKIRQINDYNELLIRVERGIMIAEKMLATGFHDKDNIVWDLVAKGNRELRETAKVVGFLMGCETQTAQQQGPITEHPDWLALKGAIVLALRDHPAAVKALIEQVAKCSP